MKIKSDNYENAVTGMGIRARRLVDRLVETDPEYIEQLRRGRS